MNKIELIPTDYMNYSSRVDLYRQRKDITLSFVSPILFALLMGLKYEVVQSLNGIDKIRLRELARNYREGDGDCGICFEYSIHSAIRNNSPSIMQRINEALNLCGIYGKNTTSILLGFEKNRVLQINDELISNLTGSSVLITDAEGGRINLLDYIFKISQAFSNINIRRQLPRRINDVWKADLLLGNREEDLWAAVSVKINPMSLVPANGIAIGIVPSRWNRIPSIRTKKKMIICPLLYDNGFMQFFYSAWRTVMTFLSADAHVPHERCLYCIEELQIAEYLETQRESPVIDLVEDIFSKLTHKTIILPKEKSIITTDIIDTSNIQNTNRSIIVPNLLLPDSTL